MFLGKFVTCILLQVLTFETVLRPLGYPLEKGFCIVSAVKYKSGRFNQKAKFPLKKKKNLLFFRSVAAGRVPKTSHLENHKGLWRGEAGCVWGGELGYGIILLTFLSLKWPWIQLSLDEVNAALISYRSWKNSPRDVLQCLFIQAIFYNEQPILVR